MLHNKKRNFCIKLSLFIVLISINNYLYSQQETYSIGLLKYSGGGDWYANPTSLPNLIEFCNENINTSIKKEPVTISLLEPGIFDLPFIHLTGHGNIVFSDSEVETLRNYLYSGGFLHIDDNYGLDQYIRREIKKVFPDKKWEELPYDHPIFSSEYKFSTGLPKVHEHDKKRPQAFGLFHEGRLICLYTYEADLGDGWEDKEVHNDSNETRIKALQMGANIISYVFNN